jgi:glycosyltransferase involved in cell wall biosynthesis
MSARPSVTAVLPAYNEAAVIADVVAGAAAAMLAAGIPDPEIVVVDDGSTDRTAELAPSRVPPAVRVRVIHHALNRGYGAALRTGFDAASGDAVWLMDSDGQFDPADLGRLLPHYGTDRLVAGYRIRRNDAMLRRLNHAAFFSIVRLLFGRTVRDVNCGFKLFPSVVGRSLRADGALISTELVLRARRAGYRTVEVGVPHYPRRAGHATGAAPRVVVRAFAELWRLRRHPGVLDGLPPPPG